MELEKWKMDRDDYFTVEDYPESDYRCAKCKIEASGMPIIGWGESWSASTISIKPGFVYECPRCHSRYMWHDAELLDIKRYYFLRRKHESRSENYRKKGKPNLQI
jgi:DNA-directed RNA polymerase subunit RPC12/RpoP